MSTTIREPKQKRSIETKERIVSAGFALFSEKGFHNTNTVEIAKRAGVSTGIVYNYFADKKAIFLSVCERYAEQITVPMYSLIEKLRQLGPDLNAVIAAILDAFITSHTMVRAAHEEMMAMTHSDPDVAALFNQLENQIDLRLTAALEATGIRTPYLLERVHVAHGIVETYCHEFVYHQHEHVDYAAMRDIVIRTIYQLVFPS